MSFFSRFRKALCGAGFLSAAAMVALAGCAGGSAYTVDEAELAIGHLPSSREVPHPPDSLAHLTIVEKEKKMAFEIDRSFREMLRAWSSTWQSSRGSALTSRGRYHTYATLWSLEASLASLVPERDLEGLSKDLAKRMIEERKEEYQNTVQIDVYRFSRSPSASVRLDGSGNTVTLKDGQGNEYRPVRIESGIIRETSRAGTTVFYTRNAVFFERFVDGKDILADVERLRLDVHESQLFNKYYFTWTFPQDDEPAAARLPQR